MEKRHIQISLSTENVSDLRGKQSVRTTFRLPQRSIMALSLLATQLGIKQKSLFDHLGEDVEMLKICAEMAADEAEVTPMIAKTYVVSKKTLDNLEKVASSCNASRNALVVSSIQRIIPILERERQKHELRKKVVKDLEQWLERGQLLLQRSRGELGSDDPAVQEIDSMLDDARRAFVNLENMIEKGKGIENF